MEFYVDLVSRLEAQIDPALLADNVSPDDVRYLAAAVAHVILDSMAENIADEDREQYLELARAGIVEGVMLSDCEGSESHAH